MDLLGCSNATQPFGQLRNASFDEIWNSPNQGFARARTDLREGRVPVACSKCIYAGSFLS